MLPKPNYDAKVPSDVYKLEQFLPDNFDQFKSGYEQESLKYFKSVDSYQNLINFGKERERGLGRGLKIKKFFYF